METKEILDIKNTQEIVGDEYKILGVLGSGGMGSVYLAEERALRRTVVIKTIKAEFREREDFSIRFRREAMAAARVKSPYVVGVLKLIETEEIMYQVLEHVPGRNLREEMRERFMSGAFFEDHEVVRIISQIARGLAAIHDEDIIHRDIKAANIVLQETSDGETVARIIDFGVAWVEGEELTTVGQLVGTISHLPPEYLKGTLTKKADQFGLGVVMYQLLTAQSPFSHGNNVDLTKKAVLEKTPPAPIELRPDISPALSAVCMSLLNKDPEERLGEAESVFYYLSDLNRVGPQLATLEATVADGPLPTAKVVTQIIEGPVKPPTSAATPADGSTDYIQQALVAEEGTAMRLIEAPPATGYRIPVEEGDNPSDMRSRFAYLRPLQKSSLGAAALLAVGVLYFLASERGQYFRAQAGVITMPEFAPTFTADDIMLNEDEAPKTKEEPVTPEAPKQKAKPPRKGRSRASQKRKMAAASTKEAPREPNDEDGFRRNTKVLAGSRIVLGRTAGKSENNRLGIAEFESVFAELKAPINTAAKKTVVIAKLTRDFAHPDTGVLLKKGTLFFGKFSYYPGPEGRIEITFDRLKLPSRDMLQISAQATDLEDQAGIAATPRETNNTFASNTGQSALDVLGEVVGSGTAKKASERHEQQARKEMKESEYKTAPAYLAARTKFKIQFLQAL